MKVIINFLKGFTATKKVLGMVLLLFIINLLFSLIASVPMYHSLKNSLGDSVVGEKMAQGFDYLWWQEFRDQAEGLEQTFIPSIIGKGAILNNLQALVSFRFLRLPPALLILVLLYILLHTFLAGGILSVFMKETPRFCIKDFFKGAGAYFSRFFLLMIISWLFFWIIGRFLSGGLHSILQNIRQNAFSEVTPFYIGLLFNAIILFFIFFIHMAFDYARIHVVVEESRNVTRSTWKALGFVFKNLGSTLGLYYLLILINTALTVITILIKGWVPQSAWFGVITVFFIQQIFMFALIGLRCWLYSSQLELYRYLK